MNELRYLTRKQMIAYILTMLCAGATITGALITAITYFQK